MAYYLNSGTKEIYLAPRGKDIPQKDKKSFQTVSKKTPPSVPKDLKKNYIWFKTNHILREFIHPGTDGYDAIKDFSGFTQKQVDADYGGCWEEAILEKLSDMVSNSRLKMAAHKKGRIIDWKYFTEASKARGSRDKIKPIDTILKTEKLSLNELEMLIQECETYLGLKDKQKSKRRPAVQRLLKAVQQLYAFAKVSVREYDQVKDLFEPAGIFNKEIRDADGFTLLGRAITAPNVEVSQIQQMVQDGFDINASQIYGLKPLDIAVATAQKDVEDYLRGIDGIQSIFPDTVEGENTVDILTSATFAPKNLVTRDIKQAYTNLYSNTKFRPIMDLAAKSASNVRNTKGSRGLRLFLINGYNTGILGAAGAGDYNPKNNSLRISTKGDNAKAAVVPYDQYLDKEKAEERDLNHQSMEGTLIHELTHFASQETFGNTALPYMPLNAALARGNPGANTNENNAIAYYEAYIDDCEDPSIRAIVAKYYRRTSNIDQLPGKMNDASLLDLFLYCCIYGHVFSYAHKSGGAPISFQYKKIKSDLLSSIGNGEVGILGISAGIGQEIISHISQALHCFGEDEVNRLASRSLAWYKNNLIPAISDKLNA